MEKEKIYVYFDKDQNKSIKEWFDNGVDKFCVNFSCFLSGFREKSLIKFFTLSSKVINNLELVTEFYLDDYSTKETENFISDEEENKDIRFGKLGSFTTSVQLDNGESYFDLVYTSSIFPKDISNLNDKWKYLDSVKLGKFLWELK